MSDPFAIKSLKKLSQDNEKWKSMIMIDKNLPTLRQIIEREIHPSRAIDRDKVTSLVLMLIDQQSFRIGRDENQSFGVSTVLNEHIKINKNEAIFEYIGKKGVPQRKIITDPKVILALKQQKKFSQNNNQSKLFVYQETNGDIKEIRDDFVRNKLEEVTGTRKIHSFRARKANQIIIDKVLIEKSKGYREALQEVVSELGHFRKNKLGQWELDVRGSTAESSYLHPQLLLLKGRTGRFPEYQDIENNEGIQDRGMTRKEIIKQIREGNLKTSSRNIFMRNE